MLREDWRLEEVEMKKREMKSHEALDAGDLRRLRVRLRLSQEEMAAALGVSYVTINRWENGRHSPSRMAQAKIEAMMRGGGAWE